jgi:hypothetical protein
MKQIDQYHRWVEWSDEDQVYIGKCPEAILRALVDVVNELRKLDVEVDPEHYVRVLHFSARIRTQS